MSWAKLVLIYKTPYVSNYLHFHILMSEMHSIIQIHNFSEMVLSYLNGSTHTEKLKSKLEQVQCRAARYVTIPAVFRPCLTIFNGQHLNTVGT
jgi:hypothetical protein